MLLKVLILALFFLFFVPKVEAEGIEISPAFIEVTLDEPAQEKEIELTLKNTTNQSLTLELYAVDFKQQDEFGKIGFVGSDSNYSYSLASFLSFPAREIELLPQGSQKVVITVRNRQDLSPGGHYAAIVARLLQEGERKVGDSVVSPSLSSLVLLRKSGGERFNLSLTRAFWPEGNLIFSYPQRTELLFQNEGNIHVIPYGRVEVKDMFGRIIMDGMVNPSSSRILPQSRRRIEALLTPLRTPLPLSFTTVTISGQDSLKKTSYTYQETFIYINPWLGLIPLVGIGGWVVWKRRKKYVES